MSQNMYAGQSLVDMLREQIDASKDDAPDLHGALIRQRQAQMCEPGGCVRAWTYWYDRSVMPKSLSGCRLPAPSTVVGTWLDADTGEAIVQGAIGGGGGNASHASASGSNGGGGGHGGLSMLCQFCGKQATRFANWGECTACNMKRCALAEPHDAHVRARAAQPAPVQSHCECGASFATVKRFECVDGGAESYCGDCWSAKPGGALPDRIAAAQKPDADPTQAWGAGATPGYDWEGR